MYLMEELLLLLAEMCIMSNIGCEIKSPKNININSWLFGEDQGRYIIISSKSEEIIKRSNDIGINASILGKIKGEYFSVNNNSKISIEKLANLRNNWFRNYFSNKQ